MIQLNEVQTEALKEIINLTPKSKERIALSQTFMKENNIHHKTFYGLCSRLEAQQGKDNYISRQRKAKKSQKTFDTPTITRNEFIIPVKDFEFRSIEGKINLIIKF